MSEKNDKKVVVIGAGPAGLTAAYELCGSGVESTVLEKDHVVGGISRTVRYKGYSFDIGGHRFFTKAKAVKDMWHDVLERDLLRRRRVSRIYYDQKFFQYPLRPLNTLFGLGLWKSLLILFSYVRAQLFPEKPERSFEDWVSNRFGKRLYRTFFKSYTEKVWGIPCSEISADWASQRIKGLTLLTAIKNAMIKKNDKNRDRIVRTLTDEFIYPKLGPGMMWETVAEMVKKNGCHVHLNSNVERILWKQNRVEAVETENDGQKEVVKGTDYISSMPLSELIQRFEPSVPEEVLKAANDLHHRDYMTAALIINKADVFPDNWIYVHSPDVRVGRIQNYKNWSPFMVPDPNKTCVGLEYFCSEGDELWTMPDYAVIELGKRELEVLGLARASDVEDGTVVRMPKAYPIYDFTYHDSLKIIRQFLNRIENLQVVGRNGMHRYNNQDHSMLTAKMAAENIRGANHDLWEVNEDEEYHEVVLTEAPLAGRTAETIGMTFARMDKLALATAVASVLGLSIFVATLWLLIRGGEVIGPHLRLLGEYFLGYTVTMKGAFIGMSYGFICGFLFGWLFAYLRNTFVASFLYEAKKKAELSSSRDFLDKV